MPDNHLSSRFDADINGILAKVFEMGGIVESQVINAMQTLNNLDLDLVDRIIMDERRLNALEAEVDEECINIMMRSRASIQFPPHKSSATMTPSMNNFVRSYRSW